METTTYYMISASTLRDNNTTEEIVSPSNQITIYGILYRITITGLQPLTALIGLFTNLLTLIVFCQIPNWTSTILGLFTLTVVDFIFVVNNIIYVFVDNFRFYQPSFINIYYKVEPILLPILLIFRRLITMIPPVITAERFFVVLFPLKVKDIWTKKVMAFVLSGIIILAVLLHVPFFFMFTTETIVNNETGSIKYMMVLTPFGKDKSFWVPYRSMIVIVIRVIPVILVALMSIVIAVGLFRSMKIRKELTEISQPYAGNFSKEIRLTKTVLGIAVLFTIFLIPEFIVNVVIMTDDTVDFHDPNGGQALFMQFANLFMGINSCINFVIYLRNNRVYREHYKRLILCRTREKSTMQMSEYPATEVSTVYKQYAETAD